MKAVFLIRPIFIWSPAPASDGGFDCSAEPESQEELSSDLKRAEYEAIWKGFI